MSQTHHSSHCSWLLDAQCLHHLEHIHCALCLTALNAVQQSTEHSTPTHRVPESRGGRGQLSLSLSPSGPVTHSPSMDDNGSVATPPLGHTHPVNDLHESPWVCADSLRGPASQLELSHPVGLTTLEETHRINTYQSTDFSQFLH